MASNPQLAQAAVLSGSGEPSFSLKNRALLTNLVPAKLSAVTGLVDKLTQDLISTNLLAHREAFRANIL